MARYPGAQWRPIGDNPLHQPEITSHDGIILHTMAGTLAGTEAAFRVDGYVGVESHFGVGADGRVYQWGDTSRTADANLEGNPFYLSVETEDMGPGFPDWSGSNVPAWTPAQVDAISTLVAWAAIRHGFPVRAMEDSQHRRGVGWHRLGIDASTPRPGWRNGVGQLWSTSTGKVCPGDRRIAQIKDLIIPRAQAIVTGGTMNAVEIDLGQDITPVVNQPGEDGTVGDALRAIARIENKVDRLLAPTAQPGLEEGS